MKRSRRSRRPLRRSLEHVRTRAALRELERIASGGESIVAGPWAGGLAGELLHWIPFLNWVTSEAGISPERIIAVSQGGAARLYQDVAGRYVDLLDHFDEAQLVERRATWTRGNSRSSLDIRRHRLDNEAFLLAAHEASEGKRPQWLHPAILGRLHGTRNRRNADGHADDLAVHRLLPASADSLELPARYVALLVEIGDSIADTEENGALLEKMVEQLSEQTEVVLIRSNLMPDRAATTPYIPTSHERLRDPLPAADPRVALALVSEVIARAVLLISSYSDFSFLGPYLSTPTLALYSRAVPDLAELNLAEQAGRRLGTGRQLFRARHIGSLRAAKDAAESAVSFY